MRLARIGPASAERPVLVTDETAYDLSGVIADIDGEFLASGGLERVSAALADGSLPAVDIAGERVGAPIARPSAIVCIGMNYAAHAAESGSAIGRASCRERV